MMKLILYTPGLSQGIQWEKAVVQSEKVRGS